MEFTQKQCVCISTMGRRLCVCLTSEHFVGVGGTQVQRQDPRHTGTVETLTDRHTERQRERDRYINII